MKLGNAPSMIMTAIVSFLIAGVLFMIAMGSGEITNWIFLLFIGIFLGAAMFIIIWLVAGGTVAPVKKAIQENGWYEEQVEENLLSGLVKKHIFIGQNYVAYNSLWKWYLCSARDVIWAYQYTHKTNHRLYGVITVGTTVRYELHMYLRDGKRVAVVVKSAYEATEILNYLSQKYPHIFLGYSDKIVNLAKQSFSQLVQFSEEKGRAYYQKRDN